MTGAAPRSDISRRIGALATSRPGVDPAEVAEIAQQVASSMGLDSGTASSNAGAEIQDLSRFIQDLKADLAALRPDAVIDEHLPAAKEELQAVVDATEGATNEIFEAVEAIETLTGKMNKKHSAQVTEAVTRIYEACGFQDITGQRIAKVVSVLGQIELTVNGLLEVFGEEVREAPRERPAAAEPDSDKHLMGGPQLPEAAMSQADIDALLASFD